MIVSALASRLVSAGTFHLLSIVASTEVWSWTTFVTPPGLEYGEMTIAGTRGPYVSYWSGDRLPAVPVSRHRGAGREQRLFALAVRVGLVGGIQVSQPHCVSGVEHGSDAR